MSKKSKIIGAVEIGSTTIKVVIGKFKHQKLCVLSHAECPSNGVVKGTITNLPAAKRATQYAILTAERSAATRIPNVYLAQTGGHIQSFYHEVSVNVAGTDGMVSDNDIVNIAEAARKRYIIHGYSIVEQFVRLCRLDDRLVVPDVKYIVGQRAQRLEAGYLTVYSQSAQIAAGFDSVNRGVISMISGHASGMTVTSAEERKSGTLVIDIGGGTTDYVLYHGGSVYATGVLAVGGCHLTHDLSLGLRITDEQAEKVKLRFGRATVSTSVAPKALWLNRDLKMGDHPYPLYAIEHITSARLIEIFEIVKRRFGPDYAPEHIGAGIVLTGGTSKLPDIANAASQVFGLPARLGAPQLSANKDLCDPCYSTVLGLFHYHDELHE